MSILPADILLHDDSPKQGLRIKAILERKGHRVAFEQSAAETLKAYRASQLRWKAIVTDSENIWANNPEDPPELVGRFAGLNLLREIKKLDKERIIPAVILTMSSCYVREAQNTTHRDLQEHLVLDKSSLGAHRLAIELVKILDPVEQTSREQFPHEVLLDELPDLKSVLEEVRSAAYLDDDLLLWGEPGVGKEALARYYFLHSGRRGRFNVVNAGSLAGEGMLISLCGRAANFPQVGSPAQPGAFEQTGHGVIHLRNLDRADTNDHLFAFLLNAMDGRSVQPMGWSTSVPIQCAIVASVNDPARLSAAFRARFRRQIEVPPLRQRPQDFVILAKHFRSRAGSGVTE